LPANRSIHFAAHSGFCHTGCPIWNSQSSMRCPFCAAENVAAANYCSNCGSPQNLRVCPRCETVNSRAANACSKCGHAFGSASGLAAAMGATDHRDAGVTSGADDISRVKGDTASIKELLASLEKEVDRQLAEDARLPSSASAPPPRETNPSSADRTNAGADAAAPNEKPTLEREPLLARTGYDSPNVPSTPRPAQPESAAPPNETLPVLSTAAKPEPLLSSEVFPIHAPALASHAEPLRQWDVEPRPQEYRPAPWRGKRVALATLLVLLVGAAYAYYNRYGFDLQVLKTMVPLAAKSAPQVSPPSAGNTDSIAEIAKASSPPAADMNSAPSTASTGDSESASAETAGDRNSSTAQPVESAVSPDTPSKCPEAVQALGLCASMGKK
jgi:hypothetical protein